MGEQMTPITEPEWMDIFDAVVEERRYYTDAMIANAVLKQLLGYNQRSRKRSTDSQSLACALVAFDLWLKRRREN
jgi:hypothetical protein